MSSEWRADIPIYRQIVDRLLEGILDGTYEEGSLLPSVRQIAEIFDVSAITGAKVVQEMDKENVTVKKRGVGTHVKAGARDALLARERNRFWNQEWPAFRERIEQLDIPPADLVELLQKS